MISEVERCLENPRAAEIIRLYKEVLGKELSRNCSTCIDDAKRELSEWLKKERLQMSGINLFINRYTSPNPERQQELDICYQINLENKFITRIIEVQGRKINDFFEAMRGYPDDVNIISNADIFFNETIELVKGITDFEAFCLGRWEYNGNGHADLYNVDFSQDVWVIRGKPKAVNCEFNMGVPGIDNRLAYYFKQAGYVVKNPSRSIQCVHYHKSEFRTYSDADRLPEPYLFVKPCFL